MYACSRQLNPVAPGLQEPPRAPRDYPEIREKSVQGFALPSEMQDMTLAFPHVTVGRPLELGKSRPGSQPLLVSFLLRLFQIH